MKSIPEIRTVNGITTLFVDGKPFLARAGEIHNSSSSSLRYMEEHVWPNLKGLHMNSVIVPLYWETMEPEEGVFDFTLLDGLLAQARTNGMRLIFLWFGLWKNSESTYIPQWMKTDTETYFRVEDELGKKMNIVSPFCRAAVEKDALAFSRVMAHLREADSEERTTIFLQVENEIGVLHADRDHCAAAEAAFAAEVPEELRSGLGVSGTWSEAFGVNAGECLMAWAYSGAVNTIASAGRGEYPLPCYVNAWLRQYPWYPGSYPMGGPVPGVFPIWRVMAPSLFAFGPDIYVPYATQIMEEYHQGGNPLVIPEIRKDAVTASYALYAFMHHNALCYSPFGIEDLALSSDELDKPSPALAAALNIDLAAWDTTDSFRYLAKTYALLEQLEPLYLKLRGTSHLQSYTRLSATDFGAYLQFGKYDVLASYAPVQQAKPVGAGVIFELEEDTFLLCGMMHGISFRTKADSGKQAAYLRIEEGEIRDGEFVPNRILNGDEQMQLRFGDSPACFRVKLFAY